MENKLEEPQTDNPGLISRLSKFLIDLTRKVSLRQKIAICFCCLSLTLLSGFWLLLKTELQHTLQQQTDGLGQTLARQAANSIQELVLVNDLLSLNVVLSQFIEDDNLLRITVYNIDEQIIAAAQSTDTNNSQLRSSDAVIAVTYTAQITLQDSIAGTVQLQLDTTLLQANIEKAELIFWVILGLSLLLTIILAFILTAQLSSTLLQIEIAMDNPLESTLALEPELWDEVSLVQSSCASLIEQYQQNYYELQRFTGVKSATSGALAGTEARKAMASILIVKVVNINTAIELLHPTTLSELLSEYLHHLTQASQLYSGSLQQVTGEYAMLVFNPAFTRRANESASTPNEHSFNAICCAQLFIKIMEKIKQKHKDNAAQALTFKLAIHSGDIFSASSQFRSEISEGHQDKLVMGKTLEACYFLCNQSPPNALIISESTYSQAQAQTELSPKASKEITMPSDNISFMAYILDSDKTDYAPQLDSQSLQIIA